MGNGHRNENSNIYYQARKNAALFNERLYSREKASEIIGVSESQLASYELGNTKSVPPDKVNIMADIYNRPDLKTHYCKNECPLGKNLPIATEIRTIEQIALHMFKSMKLTNMDAIKEQLIEIAADGEVTQEEMKMLLDISMKLHEMAEAISSVKLLVDKLKNGGIENGMEDSV